MVAELAQQKESEPEYANQRQRVDSPAQTDANSGTDRREEKKKAFLASV